MFILFFLLTLLSFIVIQKRSDFRIFHYSPNINIIIFFSTFKVNMFMLDLDVGFLDNPMKLVEGKHQIRLTFFFSFLFIFKMIYFLFFSFVIIFMTFFVRNIYLIFYFHHNFLLLSLIFSLL